MSIDKVKKIIKDNGVKFADLRFADMSGREQHLSIPASTVDDALFEDGKMFDGSSIAGWKGINESDMVLLPDSSTVFLDPFAEESTLVLRCDVLEPSTMQPYSRCPRGIAKRAEAYLKAAGVGDTAFFGPEPEFFIFDSVRSSASINGSFYEIESEQGAWNSGKSYEHGNTGHRPGVKGGYFPTGPVDAFQDLRSAMCLTLEALGIPVEVHHSEVATGGQCEIGTRFNTLVKKSDELLTLKYVVKNIAHQHGHTATFMPKPLVGDNGSGMHVHQSIAKGGKNLFSGNEYGGLSKMALHYIAGVFKHARAVNAFTNSGTNSYKRLVPGFEAPVLLAYSARNRSASCRIPWVSNPHRGALPGCDQLRLPDLHRADDGRPRRHQEQARSRRTVGQGSVRPAAGGGEADSDRVPFAGSGTGSAGCRPRVPQGRWRDERRLHRRLHRAQDEGSHRAADAHSPGRDPAVLLGLTAHRRCPRRDWFEPWPAVSRVSAMRRGRRRSARAARPATPTRCSTS
jgi:glutamine synthetase